MIATSAKVIPYSAAVAASSLLAPGEAVLRSAHTQSPCSVSMAERSASCAAEALLTLSTIRAPSAASASLSVRVTPSGVGTGAGS
jgi:hypothetical protein